MTRSFSTVILPSFHHIYILLSNSLIIAYVDSGHGGQVKDETGTEADGMDEGMYWVLPIVEFPH